MSFPFTVFGKAISKALEIFMGILGGLFWAIALTLSLVFLYRIELIQLWIAIIFIIFIFGLFLILGILLRKRFSLYIVPFLILFLEGDHSSGGTGIPMHLGLSMVIGVISIAFLCISILTISHPAFFIGVIGLVCYQHITGKLATHLNQ